MMQKQRFLFFSLTVAALLLISSCNDIRFETMVVNEQIPLLAENDTTLPHAELTLSFTYPEKFRDEVRKIYYINRREIIEKLLMR